MAQETEQLKELIIQGLQNRKASDIVIMDLKKIDNSITDYFVIATGTSDTQLNAIAESVTDEVKKHSGELPVHMEGKQNKEWILLDYVDIVVHLFKNDKREFYGIEKLWGDAEFTHLETQQ